MYQAPLVYRVAKPFTAGGTAYTAGDVLTAEAARGLRLSVLVSSRYLLPDVDPYARRAFDKIGNQPTTIVGGAYPELDVLEGMTIPQVTAWVGTSSMRAQFALDWENTQETPRSTLITALDAIVAAGG